MIKDDITLILEHITHTLVEADEKLSEGLLNKEKRMWYLGYETSLEELQNWINENI